jgi:DNA-binding NarL/FixJ family response regulator
MSAEPELALVRRLRVLVRAADPARRDALLKLVREGGCAPVDTVESADVVLCDAGLIMRIAGEAQDGFASIQECELHGLFTPRELEVLNAIADGLTNKMIARRLEISLHTVKFHVESVFRKLGVRTRTEAVAKALERRLRGTLVL